MAAIVVLLSMVGESAAACEGKNAPKSARSCCASRSASGDGNCCCKPAEDSSRSVTSERTAAPALVEVGLLIPQRPCECRPGEPAAPASKPESRPAQARPDHDRDESVAFAFGDRAAVKFAPLSPHPDGPPKIPLYLRTSRLLI